MQVGAWLIPANFALPSISIDIDKNIVRRVLTKDKERVSPEELTLQLAYIERGIFYSISVYRAKQNLPKTS